MKHRILIEFEASKPLPADFTDVVLNRVYTLDCVDKVECTATLVGDVMKDAERYQWWVKTITSENAMDIIPDAFKHLPHDVFPTVEQFGEAIDAAKDTK